MSIQVTTLSRIIIARVRHRRWTFFFSTREKENKSIIEIENSMIFEKIRKKERNINSVPRFEICNFLVIYHELSLKRYRYKNLYNNNI